MDEVWQEVSSCFHRIDYKLHDGQPELREAAEEKDAKSLNSQTETPRPQSQRRKRNHGRSDRAQS